MMLATGVTGELGRRWQLAASTLPAASKNSTKRKSGTTTEPCLADVVYWSMCKIWSKYQAKFLIW